MGYWARAKNGEPMALWQTRQWQMRTLVGRPRAWKRTWPHRQPPSRTTSSAISISVSSRLRALCTSPRPDRVVLDGPRRREAAGGHSTFVARDDERGEIAETKAKRGRTPPQR